MYTIGAQRRAGFDGNSPETPLAGRARAPPLPRRHAAQPGRIAPGAPPQEDNRKRRRDKRLDEQVPARVSSSETGEFITRSPNIPLFASIATSRQKKVKPAFFYLISRSGSLHCSRYQGIGYMVLLLGGRNE